MQAGSASTGDDAFNQPLSDKITEVAEKDADALYNTHTGGSENDHTKNSSDSSGQGIDPVSSDLDLAIAEQSDTDGVRRDTDAADHGGTVPESGARPEASDIRPVLKSKPHPWLGYLDYFLAVTKGLKYQPKAIFPSEMFAFYVMAKTAGVKTILESGVGFGGSTTYLDKLFPNTPIFSICKDRHDQLKQLTEIYRNTHVKIDRGDSIEIFPRLLGEVEGPVAVLIDGPKGPSAVSLAQKLKFLGAAVVAMHDQSYTVGDGFHTHWLDFQEAYRFLDEKTGDYGVKYPQGPGMWIL